MKLMKTLSAGVAAVAITTAFSTVVAPTPVLAQQTTSEIRGTVFLPNGTPASGASVTIIDTRTGAARQTTTDASGSFAARGLTVGGPYTVVTSLSGYPQQRLEGLSASLGSSTNVRVDLTSVDTAGSSDEIVVVATRANVSQLAIGPSSSFNLETLESLPSIDRDIRDVIRLDPRVTIDENNSDSISCLGGNNRFNSFTIDGSRLADGYGLNASGFPNRNNLPVPFDAVRETSVEFAPFDVEYGSFTGCNINVVTKSGENEFHGSAFGVFNSSGLTGKTIDGRTVNSGDFKDWNWGASLGGPIIKDKLWFFGSYEEVKDGGVTVDTGPLGAGYANELDFLTQAQADSIAQTLQNVYGRDVIGLGRNLPDESRRIFGRVDWQIHDDHRLELSYARLRELRQDPDDGFGFNDFSFLDNYEEEGTNSENYSARLFSQWTDNFSTEVRISRLDVEDIQNPVGGGEAQTDSPIVRIVIDNITNGMETGDLISGPGFSRSANDLQTQLDQLKFKGAYVAGDHTITAGFEVDQFDVFNLFVQDATGTITFDSVADFEAGLASEIEGNGSFTGDIRDAAAEFRRTIYTVYLQDEYSPTEDLTLTYGLRYDRYASDDQPIENPIFEQKYGFDNTQAFQGLDIWQPRFGFSWDASDSGIGETTFRGGIGVFSGGDPTVWFANNFQNFGGAIGSGESGNAPCTAADLQVVSGGAFTGLPNCITAQQIAQATQNQGTVNAVDPDFTLPSLLRFNVGFSHFTNFSGGGGFFDDWNVQVDYIRSKRRNAPDFVNLALTPTGEIAPDGRPILNAINPLLAGCDAVFQGIRQGFTGSDLTSSGACDSGSDDEDILLTNVAGKNGYSQTASIALSKEFEYTIGNVPGSFNFSFGYAYTQSKDVNPSTSSTASSNFEEVALVTPNLPTLANTQFVNNHNITIAARFAQEFIENYPTRFNIFFNAQSGRRFSYVWDEDIDGILGDSDDEARRLVYVPTGPMDPVIDTSLLSADEAAAYFAFLDSSGLSDYAGGFAPRNAFKDPWFKDMDIRFSQDLPGFFGSDRFQVFVDVENFLNLIDDGMNVFERRDFSNVAEGVELIDIDSISGGRYVLTDFKDPENITLTNPSVWAVQFGVRYEF